MGNEAIQSIAELFSITRLLLSFSIVGAGWIFLRVSEVLTRLLSRRFGRYRLQISRLFPIIRLGIWTTAGYIIIVRIFSPQANALLALAASFGIAMGLALQDVIRNIISGILILFDQPFRVGDMVQVGTHYGEVLSIGLRSVRIHTFEDSVVTIPNSMAVSEAVSNSNTGELHELVVIEFIVPATLNPLEVKQLAWEAAACSPYVYLNEPIRVLLEDHYDRMFLTRVKIKAYVCEVRLERLLASDITERVKLELITRGIIDKEVVFGFINSKQPQQTPSRN